MHTEMMGFKNSPITPEEGFHLLRSTLFKFRHAKERRSECAQLQCSLCHLTQLSLDLFSLRSLHDPLHLPFIYKLVCQHNHDVLWLRNVDMMFECGYPKGLGDLLEYLGWIRGLDMVKHTLREETQEWEEGGEAAALDAEVLGCALALVRGVGYFGGDGERGAIAGCLDYAAEEEGVESESLASTMSGEVRWWEGVCFVQ